jgi:integrase
MAKSKYKRKTRSDKFPLTLHKTGQFCKKIKGKLYYFGTDKQKALQRYLEQAAYLHAGKAPTPRPSHDRLSIKILCNLYLDHQESRAEIGEIQSRHVSDQILLLKDFVRFVGPNRPVSDISTIELQNYRKRLIKARKSPNTINNRIAAVKAMYNWALDNEVIVNAPRLKAVKKVTPPKREKPTFTVSQIHKILHNASPQMKAMIWLGLNCGFGCTDCAELKWKNVDLQNGRVDFPRGKTGIGRNLPLWSETVRALNEIPVSGELVFYTRKGNPWVRIVKGVGKGGKEKYKKTNNVSKEFSKLMKRTDLKMEKGVGFYTLRRTAATLTARSGDPFAVQRLLGHADLKMATTYVQDFSEQTDRAINNTRKLIIQDDSSPLADASSGRDE